MFAYMVAFIDRQILSLLIQPIKEDLGITDTQIGLLAGLAFAIFYSFIGIPIALLLPALLLSTSIIISLSIV